MKSIVSLLTFRTERALLFLIVGLMLPLQLTLVPNRGTIYVSATADVVADDGSCTLREAVVAANTNTPSGWMNGECPAGQGSRPDTILLANGANYSLSIGSSDEDSAADGDLDIWDNPAIVDLIFLVQGSGTAAIVQDAAPDDRVLHILGGASVKIEGLTLSGGSSVVSGGGIQNEGILTLDGCSISSNSAGEYGGGVTNFGRLTVTGSQISDNSATFGGAGLWNAGTARLEASTVSANAGDTGGGIINHGFLLVSGSTITGNSAIAGGGGLWNGGKLILDRSIVSENNSSGGGGVFNETGTTTIKNGSEISGNTTVNGGGGLTNNHGGTVMIDDSKITGNSTSLSGGGIENYGMLVVNDARINGNSALQSGGGLYNMGNSTFTHSAFLWNDSPGEGDGIFSDTGTPNATRVTNSCIVGNGDTAVYNNQPAPQTAALNWWGDASGPSHPSNPGGTGDSVSDNVDYSFWLTTAPAMCEF